MRVLRKKTRFFQLWVHDSSRCSGNLNSNLKIVNVIEDLKGKNLDGVI